MARGEHTLRGAGPSSVELTHQPPWKLSYLICQNGLKVLLLLSLCYLLMIRPLTGHRYGMCYPCPAPSQCPVKGTSLRFPFAFSPSLHLLRVLFLEQVSLE